MRNRRKPIPKEKARHLAGFFFGLVEMLPRLTSLCLFEFPLNGGFHGLGGEGSPEPIATGITCTTTLHQRCLH